MIKVLSFGQLPLVKCLAPYRVIELSTESVLKSTYVQRFKIRHMNFGQKYCAFTIKGVIFCVTERIHKFNSTRELKLVLTNYVIPKVDIKLSSESI